MDEKEILIKNIEKIHTTRLGIERIKKNLKLNTDDMVKYCVDLIKDEKSTVTKKGKNFYVNIENTEITINSSSYTIITAHLKRK